MLKLTYFSIPYALSPLVCHIYVSELDQQWLRLWLVACSAPSHYLNQCCLVVNWIARNKFQWNVNRNYYIFIQENGLENKSAKFRIFCLGLSVFIGDWLSIKQLLIWFMFPVCVNFRYLRMLWYTAVITSFQIGHIETGPVPQFWEQI